MFAMVHLKLESAIQKSMCYILEFTSKAKLTSYSKFVTYNKYMLNNKIHPTLKAVSIVHEKCMLNVSMDFVSNCKLDFESTVVEVWIFMASWITTSVSKFNSKFN